MKKFEYILPILLMKAIVVMGSPMNVMNEWRNARFGMFIHWGAYAQAGGVFTRPVSKEVLRVDEGIASDKIYRPEAAGEWLMFWTRNMPRYANGRGYFIEEWDDKKPPSNDNMTQAYYKSAYVDQFKPVFKDAGLYVDLAYNAGMKYVVITSKHHDGFCMWNTDTRYDDILGADGRLGGGSKSYEFYNTRITGRNFDPIMQVKNACANKGLMFGIYFSIWDWWHPAFMTPDPRKAGQWGMAPKDETQRKTFITYMKAQLKELITVYNPKILWFDGVQDWLNEYDRKDMRDYLSTLKPDLVFNDRGGYPGHFTTPEQGLAPGPQVHDWEACMTMNDTWGYKKYDTNWKSVGTLIRTLVTAASRGGNLLLNIGPDEKGGVPQACVDRLNAIGSWMNKYKESIYGVAPVYTGPCADGVMMSRSTTANYAYIYILNGQSNDEYKNPKTYTWPADRKIVAGRITNIARDAAGNFRIYMLSDLSSPLPVSFSGNKMTITVPSTSPDSFCAVMKVECTSTPSFSIPTVSSSTTAVTQIEAEDFAAKNPQVQGLTSETCAEGGLNVGHIYVNAWLDYDVGIPLDGIYEITYRAATPHNGRRIEFISNGAALAVTTLKNTGAWQKYDNNSTQVALTKGAQRIRLHACNPYFNLNYFKIRYVGASPNGRTIVPGTIEAENDNLSANMVYRGGISGASGGNSAIMEQMDKAGTSIRYDINVQNGGQYSGEFRVGTWSSNGKSNAFFDIYIDDDKEPVTRVYIPHTGGVDRFMTVKVKSGKFILTKGHHSIYIKGHPALKPSELGGGFSVDCFKLSKEIPNFFSGLQNIEAESFDQQSGITVQRHCDAQWNYLNPAKYCVGDIHRGDWIEFKMVTPDAGYYKFDFYTSRPSVEEGTIQIWVNGEYKASSRKIAATGGWFVFRGTWMDESVYMTKNTNTIRLVSAADYPFNLDRIDLYLTVPPQ